MPSWRAEALSAIQLLSMPSATSSDRRDAHAFAVERARAQAARAQRIVDDGHAGREDLRAEPVLEEARLARDRGAADRRRRNGRAGSTRRAGRTAPASCPAWAASSSAAPPPARRRGGRSPPASSRSSRWRALCQAWSRCIPAPSPAMTPAEQLWPVAAIGAGEAGRCRQRDDRRRGARAEPPLELVTPGTASAASSAASARARSSAGSGSCGSSASRTGSSPRCEQLGGREAGVGIFGRFARPSPGALDQRAQRFVGEVGRGDGRRPLARGRSAGRSPRLRSG